MKRRPYEFIAVLVVALAWPPIFFSYFSHHFRTRPASQGQMRDFELQKLLKASRWVFDIPPEKDGWFLYFLSKSGDETTSSGGLGVQGGKRIVLLVRRNAYEQRIEYEWYQTTQERETLEQMGPMRLVLNVSHSGSGSLDDPLASASVSSVRGDGPIADGDWLYRGASKTLSSNEAAEFEVRLRLTEPRGR